MKNDISVHSVNSIEDWLQCQQIRAAVFLNTEPYNEEFDGKEFELVVHLLAKYQGMPAACMRLRLVSLHKGGEIHWGRLATLPTTTSKAKVGILNAITRCAESYCTKVGIRKITGEVADKRLVRYWERKGFYLSDAASIWYGDREFLAMEKIIC